VSTILPRPNLPQANDPPVVLVVEDDVLIRSSAAEYLRASGYKTVEATTAAEAVDVINSGAPVDVVFTDVRMPGGMDGVELAEWVRAHHPGVPLLLTSGDAPTAASGSWDVFLPKPYSLDELARLVRSLAPAAWEP
jgi:CheY-like chemotaxis protein